MPHSAPTRPTITVVTPTLNRPDEVRTLLCNLAAQTHLPLELVLVDGAPEDMNETRAVVAASETKSRFPITYIRRGGGTAIQRNIGIDSARGEFIAFIDDDIILEPDFFERIAEAFSVDDTYQVAAVAGYVTNQYFDGTKSTRWRWYRRLGLFTIYEPGRFDYQTGYVVNRNMQPPHRTIREIDCMGAACAVWRRTLFDAGLRFSSFFVDYGVGEDAHIALSARRAGWTIWECGAARCLHMQSSRSRMNRRQVAWKTAVNYRFLFVDIVRKRSLRQEYRFWRVQFVELGRELFSAIRRMRAEDWAAVLGKFEGIVAAVTIRPRASSAGADELDNGYRIDQVALNSARMRGIPDAVRGRSVANAG